MREGAFTLTARSRPNHVRDLIQAVQELPWPLLLVLVAILTRLCIFFLSFYNGDEAVYSALASKILSGGWPYVGAVDHKPIGIEMTYALVYALFGRNQLIFVRALLVLTVAATGLILSSIGQQVVEKKEARVAGLWYVVASVWGSPQDVQAANTELFLNFPLCFAAWLLVPALRGDARRVHPRLIGAGICTAIATMYRYQSSLAGCAWAASVFLMGGSGWTRLRRLTCLAAGFMAVAAVYLGTFYFAGRWDAFVFWGWNYNFGYLSTLSGKIFAWNAFENTLKTICFWLPVLLCLKRPTRPLAVLALPWLATMLLSIAPGGRFFPHYYLVALPPLCLLTVSGVGRIEGWRRKLALGLALAFTVGFVSVSWLWYEIKPTVQRYDTAYRAVGAWVHEHSTPQDTIFVWGNSVEIYYYSDRIMGTRFFSCNYHTGKIWGSPLMEVDAVGTEAFILPQAWTDLMEDLNKNPPLYIIDGGAGHLNQFDRHPIARYPKLAQWMETRYHMVELVAGVPVYRIRTQTDAMP